LLVTWLRSLGYLQKVVTDEHYHLMGKLLFAFTVFWAYIAFSQYFLIWYANITEETRFYLTRNTEGWRWVSIFIVVGHFVGHSSCSSPQPRKKNPVVMVSRLHLDPLHAPRGHVLERHPRAWPIPRPGRFGSRSNLGQDIFALMAVSARWASSSSASWPNTASILGAILACLSP
jgi:hypothetical protein